jgi:hypothetical protein
MALTIGTQLGSHEITALLGKGGMGDHRPEPHKPGFPAHRSRRAALSSGRRYDLNFQGLQRPQTVAKEEARELAPQHIVATRRHASS